MPNDLEEKKLQDQGSKPTRSIFNTVWNGVAWRLTRLKSQIRQGVSHIWQGIEWRLNGWAWKLYSQSVYRLAFLNRPLLGRTVFIGITGSAGKTTTKDLLASILESHFSRGKKGTGTLNGPYDVARLVLRTRPSDAYCVTEIAVTNDAGIDLPVALFRPTVSVVTAIGGDHITAYGSLEALAAEKSKLVRALPDSGIAVLNADDPLVLAMQSQCAGRVITYGMSEVAMLQGTEVDASWPDRLALTVKWNGQSVRVQTQLCGDHWVPVVLAALATGVTLGVSLDAAAMAVGRVAPFVARMSPIQGSDGVTFIRDDWKAPFWTIAPTFSFMRQARAARKVIVMGTISDYVGASSARYAVIARDALAVADCVMFVGPRASACFRAKRSESDQLFAFPSLRNASTFLAGYLQPGDLVLLKGSTRADHLERLILMRTGNVECWRADCGRMYFCNECSLVHVASDPEPAKAFPRAEPARPAQAALRNGTFAGGPPTLMVVGLGNPGERYTGTPHNVGHCAVDILAQRLEGTWTRVGDLAMVACTRWQGRPVCMVKLLTSINEAGPTLMPLAKELGFTARDCIFVHDDLDLPIGTVRARQRGSDGGHRGVQSIIEALQDDQFRRVKIGIGKPAAGQTVAHYVLTPFPPEKLAAVDAANHVAADRVLQLVQQEPISRSSLPQEVPAQAS